MASYPSAVFSPAARSNGQTIDASHVNSLQDEVTAIEAALEGTITHSVNVSGNSTLAKLSASNSTLATLTVTGGSTLASLGVAGNSTVTGHFGVTGNSTFVGTVGLSGYTVATTGTLTLGSGDTHDVAVSSLATFIRIGTNNANSTMTGIASAGGLQMVKHIWNAGPTGLLGLKAATGSVSTNQFLLASDTTVAVGYGVTVLYDAAAQRWILISR
jgi:hypothetical protein